MISACVVTFNPDIIRLQNNLDSLTEQVDRIFVVDNCSYNRDQLIKIKNQYDVILLQLETNMGLAKALNIGVNRAIECGSDWILMMDQDSILPLNYIDAASWYFLNSEIGIICPLIYENNIGESLGKVKDNNKYIKRTITSGSLVKKEAFICVNGYDEYFFVDYVDFDFCVRIRMSGFKILQMQNVFLNHELGISKKKRFLFWNFRYTEHNTIREYYIARNIIVYIKKYIFKENVIRDFLSLIKHYVFIIAYAPDKKQKMNALIKGTFDGLKKRINVEDTK